MVMYSSTDHYINDNIKELKPSATLLINERSKALVASGHKVYRLGFGQSPFPIPELVVQSLKNNAHQKDYLPVRGLQSLREAVASYHQSKHEIPCCPEDVLVGPGSKELLFLCQLIYNGSLLIPQPSWVSYEPQAHLASKKYHWLPTKFENGYLLDAETLESYITENVLDNLILILNFPSNPTGRTLGGSQLKEIAAVARKHRILILSDEIYGDVHHKGKHVSMAKYYPEGTIVSSGLSKWAGAGGWRLGTFLFPKELRWLLDKMAVAASETFSATSAPIQYAAVSAYEGGEAFDSYLNKSRMVLSKIAIECSNLLNAYRIIHNKSEGGFYFMLDFNNYKDQLKAKNIHTSKELCENLLNETGVAILPLSAFGMPENFLGARLAYVDFDGAKALKVIESNQEISAKELAPNVIEGISQMGKWLAL